MSKENTYNIPHSVFQHMIRGAHSQYRDISYWKSTIEPLINIWNSSTHLNPSTALYNFNFDQISNIIKIITIPPNMQIHPHDTQRFSEFMFDLTTHWSTASCDISSQSHHMSQELGVTASCDEKTIVNVEVNIIGVVNISYEHIEIN